MVRAAFKLFLSILVILVVTGCSSGVEHEEQNIIVQKQVAGENSYEDYREITDTKQVENMKEILDKAHWKDAQVDFVHRADYRFFFEYKNPEIEAKPVSHSVWISPKQDQLEVMRGEQEYTQLTKEESSTFFTILTGEELGE